MMDRRRLLQALGVTATAALVGCSRESAPPAETAAPAAAPAAEPRPSFKATVMNHLSYAVSDWQKTRDFYVDLTGMTVGWDNGRQCALEFGDPDAPDGIYIRTVGEGQKPNINHFAFGVSNIVSHMAAMKVEIERRQLTNVRPDGEHGWIMDDANGYMLNAVSAERDPAMFPGAAGPCKVADSQECRDAYEAGRKNLDKAPKPSGRGFKAIAFSNIVLNTTDIPKAREFYQNFFGMDVLQDTPQQAVLRFGNHGLVLRSSGGAEPFCNHFGLAIENYDHAKVEAELKRRGLAPKADGDKAWAISDPDGIRVDIASADYLDYLASSSPSTTA
jgi:catechol 2,3-dioxygenase-like lactoylglutathione lyase family enzyme